MKGVIGLCGVLVLAACGDDAKTPADARVDAVPDAPDAPPPAFALDPSFGNVNGSTILNGYGSLQGIRITLLAGDVAVVSGGASQSFVACRYRSDGSLDGAFGVGCITRDWFGSILGQVAADGDAIFVAANAPVTGPRVYRVLANGIDDPSFGSSGSIILTPPSGFGSDTVATTLRRLSDGSYVAAGAGTYLSGGGGQSVWAQPMQANGTTTASALIAQAALGDVLGGASPTFVLDNGANVTGCPATACGTNEVCRFDACVATPASCATSATCGVNEYCHQSLFECLPDDVGFFRTHVVQLSSDLATTVSDHTVGNRNSGRVVALTGGAQLLLQRQVAPNDPAGMWKLTASGALDRTFGSNGLAASTTKLSAAIVLPDGRIVAATADETGVLQRYSAAGVLEAMTTEPLAGLAIQDIALTSDGKLLVAGISNQQSFVVQRFVMNP